jgi:hypothetical protein
MPRIAGLLIGLFLLLSSLTVVAASDVSVGAMNYPAWLVRDFETLPLEAGTELRQDDLVRTGKGGRVQLQLADGSLLNIGEFSRLLVTAPTSFQVLQGLFRVAPGFIDAAAGEGSPAVKIGAISVNGRNADFWGRADLAQDAVCLVAGELAVTSADAPEVDLNQALSCYVKPRGDLPLPVGLVDMRQHQLWMAETELEKSSGIAVADGQWQLVLISLTDAKRAEQALGDLRTKGFAVRDVSVVRDGRTLHRLLLPGFESIEAALSARERVEALLGVSDTWVWKAN